MSESRYDFIIVGYGPVGQTAANLLGQMGYRVAVFETATSVYNKPRAVHFDAEIMRIFQSIGLAEAVLPTTAPIKGVDFLNGDGGTLFSVRTQQRRTLNGWDGDYMFYQPQLEDALQAGAKRFDNVEVYAGHEVLDMTAHDEHVAVDVEQQLTNGTFTVTADYVIGCDGARSITRKLAEIELDDMKFDQPWLVIDTMLKRDVDLPDVAQQICDPKRPTTFVPSSGGHRRWELMLMAGDDPEEIVKIDRVWELLRPWITPDDAEVIRHVVYTFHAVIADPWRNGRMLIAGDAAHQMPPFLGQGMCAGIRDVANLCWKLDFVKRGLAPDALLDTYQEERSPHVRTIIERAVRTGGIIQTTDPEVARQRDERFRQASGSLAAGDDEDGPFNMGMPGLSGGVCQPGHERSGKLFPQGPSRTAHGREELLDEFIGSRWSVITDAATARTLSRTCLTPEIVEVVMSLDMALIALDTTVPGAPEGFTGVADETGVALNWLGAGNVAVVRPDRYVYGIATDSDSLSDLLLGLKARLAGAGEPVS